MSWQPENTYSCTAAWEGCRPKMKNRYSEICLTPFSREATKPNVLNIHRVKKKEPKSKLEACACICVKAKVQVIAIHLHCHFSLLYSYSGIQLTQHRIRCKLG
jgi:hypothetical protein